MSDIEIIKQLVSESTGVPANLISGATVEEMQTSAKAISDFKAASISKMQSDAPEQHKTEADLFSDWFNQSLGRSVPEQAQEVPTVSPAYPIVRDGGEIMHVEPKQTTADLFAECFQQSANFTWNSIGFDRGGLL